MKAPVALIIFTKQAHLPAILKSIRSYAPKKFYLIGDGGRDPEEMSVVLGNRDFIKRNIDWDCEVVEIFSEENLGCRKRVVSGISAVFQDEETCIILEDDCIADPSFYIFCEFVLGLYADDNRIMAINGTRFGQPDYKSDSSFTFTKYPSAWGWATWRRAWTLYDDEMTALETLDRRYLSYYLGSYRAGKYWMYTFRMVRDGRLKHSVWDHRWFLSCISQNGLAIVPTRNLITNLGFGVEGTHTSKHADHLSLESSELKAPFQIPKYVIPDSQYDRIVEDLQYSKSFLGRMKWFAKDPFRSTKLLFEAVKGHLFQ